MVLPFDELNELETKYNMPFLEGIDQEAVTNDIYDLLIAAFIYGSNNINEMLGVGIDLDAMKGEKIIFKKIGGKTWLDRLNEEIEFEDEDRPRKPRVLKKWNTMEDERVRLSHAVLQGAEVGVREYFRTIDGDKAQAPGMFETARNNVNCRCWLTYRKA